MARRGCSAPGVVTVAAAGGEDRVVGFARACGDGVVQSFLAQLGVDPEHRGRGLGRRLVTEVLAATGTQRVDLLAEDDAAGFYRGFAHREKLGLRLYPHAPR